MNSLKLKLFLIFSFFTVFLPINSSQSSNNKIYVVNLDELYIKTSAGKDIQNKLKVLESEANKILSEIKKEFDSLQKQLQKLQNELEENKKKSNSEKITTTEKIEVSSKISQIESEMRTIIQKLESLQKLLQEEAMKQNQKLYNEQENLLKEFKNEFITPTINLIAKNNNISLIIPSTFALFYSPEIDLTEKVIDEINALYKNKEKEKEKNALKELIKDNKKQTLKTL